MDHWFAKVDDIDNGLAADFNGSLSGLGVESISDTYNMSEALLALPVVFKDEEDSLINMALMNSTGHNMAPFLSLADVSLLDSEANIYISPSPVDCIGSNPLAPIIINEKIALDQNNAEWLKLIKSMKLTEISDDSSSLVIDLISEEIQQTITYKFQYVLKAPTSPSAKLSDETLTYLNQGQLYELKLRFLTESIEYSKHFPLKSIISLTLEDRKIKMEEQLVLWQKMHPRERLFDFDSKLSNGFSEIKFNDKKINCLEIIWDPCKFKQALLMLKINCISTEFTVKKLGGEKGIPFRLQVETFSMNNMSDLGRNTTNQLLHKASCLVKVFKMRGADRKNKTDREKLEKSSLKKKYQPYFECTVLTEMPLDITSIKENESHLKSPSISQLQPTDDYLNNCGLTSINCTNSLIEPASMSEKNINPMNNTNTSQSSSRKRHSESCICISSPAKNITSSQEDLLTSESSPDEVINWLERNRFIKYTEIFQFFSGADLLRLSKDDLIQICGLADGIRLYNSLQARFVQPRLTIFVYKQKAEINVIHSPTTSSLSSSPSPSPTPISDCIPLTHILISPTALQICQTSINNEIFTKQNDILNKDVNTNFESNHFNISNLSSSISNDHYYCELSNNNIFKDKVQVNEKFSLSTDSVFSFLSDDHRVKEVFSSTTNIQDITLQNISPNICSDGSNNVKLNLKRLDINVKKTVDNISILDNKDHRKKLNALSEDLITEIKSVKNEVNLKCFNETKINCLNSNEAPILISNQSMPDILTGDSVFNELKLTEKISFPIISDNSNNFGINTNNFRDVNSKEQYITFAETLGEKRNNSCKYPIILNSNNYYKYPVLQNCINESTSNSNSYVSISKYPSVKYIDSNSTNYLTGLPLTNSPLRKSSCGPSCKRSIKEGRVDDEIHELPIATSKKQKIHHLQPNPSMLHVYHAIYMDHLTERQLACKLGELLNLDESQIVEILLHSLLGIHVLVTDLVVQNITDQSHYTMQANEIEEQSGSFRIILKTIF